MHFNTLLKSILVQFLVLVVPNKKSLPHASDREEIHRGSTRLISYGQIFANSCCVLKDRFLTWNSQNHNHYKISNRYKKEVKLSY